MLSIDKIKKFIELAKEVSLDIEIYRKDNDRTNDGIPEDIINLIYEVQDVASELECETDIFLNE